MQTLDYYIELIKLCERLTNEKEKTHLHIYNEDVENLNFIAKHLGTKPKEYEKNGTKETYLYTPLGRLSTAYSDYDKQTKHDYDIDKHIEYINKNSSF